METSIQDDEKLRIAQDLMAKLRQHPVQPTAPLPGVPQQVQSAAPPQVQSAQPQTPQMSSTPPDPQQTSVPQEAPPPQSARAPYDQSAQNYADKASALEAQARPPQRPQGILRTLALGASEGLQGAAHPGGFAGFKQEQQQVERQRQQDLLTRAQKYREESQKEQQLGLSEEQRQIENRRVDAQGLSQAEAAKHQRAMELIAAQRQALADKAEQDKPVLIPKDTAIGQRPGATPLNITSPNQQPEKQTFQQRTIEDPAHSGQPLDANYEPSTGKTYHPATGEVILNPRSFIKPDKVKEPIDSASLESIIQGIQRGDIVRENLRTMVKTEDEPRVQAELQRRNIPLMTGQQQVDVRNLDNLSNSIDAVEQLSKRVHTSDSGVVARASGLAKRGQAALGYNDDVRQMQDESLRAVTIVRALGERGRIPTQQVAMAEKMLAMDPSLTSSEAKMHLQRLRQMISDARGVATHGVGSGTASQSAVPSVGSTFNGARVTKVTPIP